MKALWLAAVASVFCAGCVMHVQTRAQVPGCAAAEVTIPKKCGPKSYLRRENDALVLHCDLSVFENGKLRQAEQTTTFTCKKP